MCLQALAVSNETQSTEKFVYAINGAISAVTISSSIAHKGICLLGSHSNSQWFELVTAPSILVAFVLLPRRPAVFFRGKQVDQEYLWSFYFGRYSFSWVSHVFRLAKVGPIRLEDLPGISNHMRTRTLKARYMAKKGCGSLWRQMIKAFASTFAHKWMLIFLKALCGFGSRFALYHLLQQLERRGSKRGSNHSSGGREHSLVVGCQSWAKPRNGESFGESTELAKRNPSPDGCYYLPTYLGTYRPA